MNKKDFLAQYQTKEWYELSKRIKARDKNTCQMCGCNDKPLSVHHKVYYKDRKVWEYEDRDLICICDPCHQYVTQEGNELYDQFKEIKQLFRSFGFSDHVLSGVFYHLASLIENFEEGFQKESDDKTLSFLHDVILGTQDYCDIKAIKRLGVNDDDFVKCQYPRLFEDYKKYE